MPHDDPPLTDSVVQLAHLGQVLQQYRTRLLAMLQRRIDPVLAKRMDAEDILSEVFLLAGRRWPAFAEQHADPAASAYPWLYRLALDCLIEAWRSQTRECRDVRADLPWPEHSSLQVGFGLIHSGTSPSQAVAQEELRRSMKRVIDLLPPKDRELLRMRHEDELTHAQAGEILGMKEAAASAAYMRALHRLRELWDNIQSTREKSR